MPLNRKPRFGFLATVSALAICGSFAISSESTARSVSPWQSPHFQQHRLVGKIWSTKAQEFVQWTWLRDEIKIAQYLLLGENHDNPDHHRWQAAFVREIRRKPAPLLVVEMIPPSLSHVLEGLKKSRRVNLRKLGEDLKWKKRGWGEWQPYAKIFQVALRHKAKIVAGNLDRGDIKRIGRKGLASISDNDKSKWSLNTAYTPAQKSRLHELLYASHCKFVPKTALSPMALVQQARDGVMAAAMLNKPKGSTAVLIAGSGHVRRDIAVPRILRSKTPDAKIISVSFVEVTPDHKKPQQYEVQSADNAPVFDYLFFTPKFDIKDHCAALAKRFGKHKAKKKP